MVFVKDLDFVKPFTHAQTMDLQLAVAAETGKYQRQSNSTISALCHPIEA